MSRKLMLGLIILMVVVAIPSLRARSAAETAAATGTRAGGVLKLGTQPINNLDPHLATSIADILLLEQLYHHLTFIDAGNRPAPDLAADWDSPDGRVWTFNLRNDVYFNDGSRVTAADVVYSFRRLTDPDFGSPVINLYKNISKIEAVNDTAVRFTLAAPNPEFASDVGDYHAAIIPSGVSDPARERIGSGAFMIKEYFPEDRIILERNPHFQGKDTDGSPLPYLDEVHLIFSPDLGGQVEALRGGELQFVGGLTTEFAETLEKDRNTKIITNDSNMHWVIHMRSDKGHIASDNRIRRAFKLATDNQALIDAVRPGLASVGNAYSPVGPAYSAYHLDTPPEQDLAKAKQLLSEAGYPDGLKITLHAQNQLDVVPIATVWKEQLARISVEVDIQVIPSDLYWGDGQESWLVTDFGITDWGARATPVTYFKLAYTSDGPWNETHWSDAEFDAIARAVDSELDAAKRVELYRQAQEIMIERGPIIVAYFVKAVAGLGADVQGIELPADWARTRCWKAWIKK